MAAGICLVIKVFNCSSRSVTSVAHACLHSYFVTFVLKCMLPACLQSASLCAHTAYQPGQEVYDSYGPQLSPSDLLLDYGFVDSSNTNYRVDIDPAHIGRQ